MGRLKFDASVNQSSIGSKYSWAALVVGAIIGVSSTPPKDAQSQTGGTEMKSPAAEGKIETSAETVSTPPREIPKKQPEERSHSTGTAVSTTTPTPSRSAESLIREYYGGIQLKDLSKVSTLLGEFVDYFDQGKIPRDKEIEDIKGDWKRYKNTNYQMSNFRQGTDGKWNFLLEYTLVQGEQPRSGQLEMTVTLSQEAMPKIVSVKAKVVRAR